jgi:hypothetical protein
MADPLSAFLIKLPLATLVFLLVAYAGTVSKRVAGVLLTFPILNGIAVIAGDDPIVVADAIYPLVIFNCVLFAIIISFARQLPPVNALPRRNRLAVRVVVWAIAWLAGAYLITHFRAQIFGATHLFAAALIGALAFMSFRWTTHADPSHGQRDDVLRVSQHWRAFVSFWGNGTGFWRIALFALAYGCLFWVSRAALDEKWVGMASALPLPGLFALAALIDDTEASQTSFLPLRDTVFLGPLLVIPFNWAFSHILVALLPHDLLLRYLLLFAMWALAALAVFQLVPRIAAYFDRRVPPAAATS